MKLAIVGKAVSKFEDGGQALILEVNDGDDNTNYEVRLHSWDEVPLSGYHSDKEQKYKHEPLRAFIGKKLLVTVEVVE